jgi:heterotetrameric sarcosine oxidase beta subunit
MAMSNPERFLPPHRALSPSVDVAIIGGGVHGLSLAYHLAKGGRRNVAVYERGYLTGGASGRNLSVIRSNYANDVWTSLFWESRKIWKEISLELDYNVMFTERGYMMCLTTPDMRDAARDTVARQNALGVPTRFLEPEEVAAAIPGIDTSHVLGAQYESTAGISRHDALVWGLAAAASRLGVQIHTGVDVTAIELQEGRVAGLKTSAGNVSTDTVVNCAGLGSAKVGAMAGVEVPTTLLPLEMFVTESYEPYVDPIVTMLEAQCYLIQTSRGEFVCGAELVGAHGEELVTTHRWIREAARAYANTFPVLRDISVVRCWAGLVDMSPDGAGMVGETEVPGFYLECGWGGYGYMVSLASGRFMAQYLNGGGMHPALAPFKATRFAEDKPIPESFVVVDFAGETRST